MLGRLSQRVSTTGVNNVTENSEDISMKIFYEGEDSGKITGPFRSGGIFQGPNGIFTSGVFSKQWGIKFQRMFVLDFYFCEVFGPK